MNTDTWHRLKDQVHVIRKQTDSIDDIPVLVTYCHNVIEQPGSNNFIKESFAVLGHENHMIVQLAEAMGQVKRWGFESKVAKFKSLGPTPFVAMVSYLCLDILSREIQVNFPALLAK
jgi:hypothetical protein